MLPYICTQITTRLLTKKIEIMTKYKKVFLKQEKFESDLDYCLTIIKDCYGKNNDYLCEYIKPCLRKETLIISIIK